MPRYALSIITSDTPGPLAPSSRKEAAASGPQASSSSAGSPEILTPRLRLRVFDTTDHRSVHRIMARPETFAFSERDAPTEEESWARLLRQIGHWSALGFGMFGVESRASGALIGEVGFADFRRDISPEFDSVPEAAWTIDPEHWGQGYATEAALAAHHWLRRQRPWGGTVCMIHEGNSRSLRLATSLGYSGFAETSRGGHKLRLFRRRPHCNAPSEKRVGKGVFGD